MTKTFEDIKNIDKKRITSVSEIVKSPINVNDFLYRDSLNTKIKNHSYKIIKFLYGNNKHMLGNINTFQVNDEIHISYGDGYQQNMEIFSFLDYIYFNFKDKEKYKRTRRKAAMLLKNIKNKKNNDKKMSELKFMIEKNPDKVYALLKQLKT